MNRRSFLKGAAAATAGITIVPAHVLVVDGILDGVQTSSPFSIAGPLTESVLMGNLAVRAFQYKQLKPGKTATNWAPYNYPGRTRLNWDGEAMKITNYKPANAWVGREYRKGWEI